MRIGRAAAIAWICSAAAAAPAQATFPGLDGDIVFAGDRGAGLASDIYAIEPDGTNLRRLTTSTGTRSAAYPSVAPAGGDIVFASNAAGNYDIYRMESDGSNQRRLTSGPENEVAPAFTNDGKRIVFVSQEQLWIIDGDGTGERLLRGPGAPVVDITPAVDAASDRVVYTAPPSLGSHWALRQIDIDGSGDRPFLSAEGSDFWEPDLAPPSAPFELAYTRQTNDEIFTDLVRPNGEVETVPKERLGGAVFSPSGTRLALGSFVGNGQIYVIDDLSNLASLRQVTHLPGSGAGSPSWAPARTSCAGERVTHGGTGGDDVVRGTRGDDVIATYDGDDVVRGRGGDDVVCAGDDADEVSGGPGDDELRGNRGADSVTGGGGTDRLEGGPGRGDRCHGSARLREEGDGCERFG